jgi:predicted DNA-binding transcriptional regulator YafY
MASGSALLRQWTLLRALCAQPGGATIRELMQELGASEKTVRRDLETFQAVGFPLQETVEEYGRKRWSLDPAKTPPSLSFAFDEAVALSPAACGRGLKRGVGASPLDHRRVSAAERPRPH